MKKKNRQKIGRDFLWCVLITGLLISFGFEGKTQPPELVLENDSLRAVFNSRTGVLEKIIYKYSNWNIQNRPELGESFELLVPLKGRRNNPVYGKKQILKSFRISADKKSITFFWTNLNSEYETDLNINITAIVSIGDNGLTFNMNLINKTPYTIEAIGYPVLGDIPQPAADENLVRISHVYQDANQGPLLPEFAGWDGYFGVDHPSQTIPMNFSSFMLISSPKQGLYIGIHDPELKELVTCNFSLRPGFSEAYSMGQGKIFKADSIQGYLQCKIWHLPFINAGETYDLVPIVLNPYPGSWHKGVDNYKRWRKSWFKSPELPAWATKVHAWLQLQINSPEEEWRVKYKDLTAIGSQCAKEGVTAIQLVGWNSGGQDRGNPSHDTDPHLGTVEEFKNAIQSIQKMGVKVILFNKYTWADRSTEWFRNDLVKYAMKDPYGDYDVYRGYQYQTATQLADVNTRRLVPMCMQSADWRNIAYTEFKKNFMYGASGMLFDECQHHGGFYLCFDRSHSHHVPAYVYGGDLALQKGFRKIVNEMNSDFLLAGESTNDFQNTEYQISYTRINPINHMPVMRYINPGMPIMIAVSGFNDRLMLNACLRYRYIISYEPFNFKGRLADFPLTLEYGKKIDSLRKKYSEFLWNGEFQDTLGIRITDTLGLVYNDYSVFTSASGKKAIVIVNNNAEKQETVRLSLKNFKTYLVMSTPENSNEIPVGEIISVPPSSSAVIMEK